MIIDSTDVQIIRESELGVYDTMKAIVVYMVERPNGSKYIRFTDGSSYIASPKTVVIEGKRYAGNH
jgi:hypothetical protein